MAIDPADYHLLSDGTYLNIREILRIRNPNWDQNRTMITITTVDNKEHRITYEEYQELMGVMQLTIPPWATKPAK